MNSYRVIIDSEGINQAITRSELDIILNFINNISKDEDTSFGKMKLKFKENGSGSVITVSMSKKQIESLKALVNML